MYPVMSKVKQVICLLEVSVAAGDMKMMWESTRVL